MRTRVHPWTQACMAVATALSLTCQQANAAEAREQRPGERPPAYQRQRVPILAHTEDGTYAPRGRSRMGSTGHHVPRHAYQQHGAPPRVSSGAWFQRPYPYHLDYYRMRYGGTYEPYYSGGLYGTPQVIVPPAYGYGFGQPYEYAYPPPVPR